MLRAGRLRVPMYLNSEIIGVGATFDMARLPVEMYAIAHTSEFQGVSMSCVWEVAFGVPTVLVVDDRPNNLTLVAGLLREFYTLKLAVRGDKSLELVDLAALLIRVADETIFAFKVKEIAVRTVLPAAGSDTHAPGEALWLYSMLHNLAKNAAEASWQGETITLNLQVPLARIDGGDFGVNVDDGAADHEVETIRRPLRTASSPSKSVKLSATRQCTPVSKPTRRIWSRARSWPI